MKSTRLAIPDVLLLKPKLFGDDRGYFFESFNQPIYCCYHGRKSTLCRTTTLVLPKRYSLGSIVGGVWYDPR
jgi:hypothetical protein